MVAMVTLDESGPMIGCLRARDRDDTSAFQKFRNFQPEAVEGTTQKVEALWKNIMWTEAQILRFFSSNCML